MISVGFVATIGGGGAINVVVEAHPAPGGTLVSHHRAGALTVVVLGELHYRAELRVGSGAANDAELVARRYVRAGLDGLRDLEGDFSVLVHDEHRRRLVALRDVMGAHPLYWDQGDDQIVVATGLALLRRARGGSDRPGLDFEFVADYLAGVTQVNESDGDRTPYRGIRRVPAGSCLCVDTGAHSARVTPFLPALTEEIASVRGDSFSAAAHEYRAVLARAVRERAVGSVACHVSGGLDSSTVLMLAADGACELTAVSAVYRQLRMLATETNYVDHALVGVPGVRSIRVAGDNLLDFDCFTDSPEFDEPYPGLWRLGMDRALTRAVSDAGATRVLTGLGADEILDAQPFHLADDLRRLRVGRAWRNARRWAQADNTNPWTVLGPFGLDPLLSRPSAARLPTRLRGRAATAAVWAVPPWIRPEYARAAELGQRVTARSRARFGHQSTFGLDFALAAVRSRVGDPIRWALATPCGLSVSHPFLDPRVVRAGLAVLGTWEPTPGLSKPLLREAMRDSLPAPILTRRRKAHFNEIYYRGLLRNRDRLAELVHSQPVADLGILDPDALMAAVDRGAVGGNRLPEMHHLNSALALARWLTQEAEQRALSKRSAASNG